MAKKQGLRKFFVISSVVVFLSLLGLLIFEYFRVAPRDIYFSNVSSSSVTVSWNTVGKSRASALVSENTWLPLSLFGLGGERFFDSRDVKMANVKAVESMELGEEFNVSMDTFDVDITIEDRGTYFTHHVEINGLDPNTEYSFLVGDNVLFRRVKDVDGNSSVMTLAVPDSVVVPNPVYGSVRDANGVEEISFEDLGVVSDGVVYFRYVDEFSGEKSSLFSSTLNEDGNWYVDTSGTDFLDRWSTEITNIYVEMVVDAGDLGVWSKRVDNFLEVRPIEPVVLNFPGDINDDVPGSVQRVRSSSVLEDTLVQGVSANSSCVAIGYCSCGMREDGAWKSCNTCMSEETFNKRGCTSWQEPSATASSYGTAVTSEDGTTKSVLKCAGSGSPGDYTYLSGCRKCGDEGKWVLLPGVSKDQCPAKYGNVLPKESDEVVAFEVREEDDPEGAEEVVSQGSNTGELGSPCNTSTGEDGFWAIAPASNSSNHQLPEDEESIVTIDNGSVRYYCKANRVEEFQNSNPNYNKLTKGGLTKEKLINAPEGTIIETDEDGSICVVVNGYYGRRQCGADIGDYCIIPFGDGSYYSGTLSIFSGSYYCKVGAKYYNMFPDDESDLLYTYFTSDLILAPTRPKDSSLSKASGSVRGNDAFVEALRLTLNAITSIYNTPMDLVDATNASLMQIPEGTCVVGSDSSTGVKFCRTPTDGKGPCLVLDQNDRGFTAGRLSSDGYVCKLDNGRELNLSILPLPPVSDVEGASDTSPSVKGTTTTSYVVDSNTGMFKEVESGIYEFTYEGDRYAFSVLGDTRDILVYIDKNDNSRYDQGTDINVSDYANTIDIISVARTYTYNIREGFNFVSFPFVIDIENGHPTASGLLQYINETFGEVIFSISKYDGQWKMVGQNTQIYDSNDFQILPGQGYVIKASATGMITLLGKPIKHETTDDNAPVTLFEGWNLVGIYGNKTKTYTAKSMILDINSQDFLSDNISKWETDKQMYEGFQYANGVEYGFDYPINQLSSYFVRVLEGRGNWRPQLGN